ncbi:MAG: LOG family protein [Acidobacteria bacterium]|nr:LOG family protein [Acidobacteriota bacterium]
MSNPGSLPPDSRIISVFGSASATETTPTYRLAQELGSALAKAGFAVASGGYGGVMEAVSRGAAEAGGRVIGIIASSLPEKANRWVQEKIVVEKWEQRLLRLVAKGDGYAVLTGGTGTLVELAIVWEMLNKRLLSGCPLVALGGFWQPVIEHIEAAEPASRGLIHPMDSVEAAVEIITTKLRNRHRFVEP